MARTYWGRRDGGLEFLGAFRDGHAFDGKRPRDPQFADAVTIDVADKDIAGVLDAMGDKVMLVDVPAAMRNRIRAGMTLSLSWGQIEGFLK